MTGLTWSSSCVKHKWNDLWKCHVPSIICNCTCCQPVSLLTPLGNKHRDLPVAPPPKHLHGQRYSSTGENSMEAVTVGRGREQKKKKEEKAQKRHGEKKNTALSIKFDDISKFGFCFCMRVWIGVWVTRCSCSQREGCGFDSRLQK